MLSKQAQPPPRSKPRRKAAPRRRPFVVAGRVLETTPVFDAYWYFAAERQRIFFRRVGRANAPELSDDEILTTYKFTNSYRASDRISQYLIRSVIYRNDLPGDPENLFFRVLLFKLFNKIETWEALQEEVGPLTLKRFDVERFDRILTKRMEAGERNYSAAYIIPSPSTFGSARKHTNHLRLLQWMIEQRMPRKLAATSRLSEAYELMLAMPSLGPFLAFQFAIDLNYSPLMSHSEMDFVVAGPGALDGISKCFTNADGIPPSAIIAAVADRQEEMFEAHDISFPSLWGRPLQLIDCQNLFCEISKYSRVAFPKISGLSGRTRIKQKFQSAGALLPPWYPPSWGINDLVAQVPNDVASLGSPTARMRQLALF